MKKILFAAVTMDVGGIETALLSLINYLAEKKVKEEYEYEIMLVLEKKQGVFLDSINKRVKIIEYKPNKNKIIIFRKFLNFMKQFIFKIKYKNTYDFSISYATYSLPDSFVARVTSRNPMLWVHSDYMTMFHDNKQKYKEFFNGISAQSFRKIVFVSEKAKNVFNENFPKLKNRTQTIYNFINDTDIIGKSGETIEEKKDNIYTFLNVGRHTEEDKKLSMLIEASLKLKQENLKFRIILIGDGKDTNYYKNLVKEKKLENEIIFKGIKKNPYPYFKISDCFIMTSEYEGFPVTYIEAMLLNLPIITTDVSDSREIIEKKYGIVVEKKTNSIYNVMKIAIQNGITIKEQFNVKEYNKKIEEKISKLVDKK